MTSSNRLVVTQDVLKKNAPQQNFADTVLVKYGLSCIAATTSELTTYPLDLTKTRLQIQGEKASSGPLKSNRAYRGLVKTGFGIVQEEGLLNLWKGVTPALYRHVIYTGTRMVLYEKVRDRYFTKRSNGTIPVWQPILSGISIGGISQFLASPADLVKVQMQMEGRRRLEGKPPRVNGALEALVKIYKVGGVRGMWKGCLPNVYRSALVNLGDLTTYDAVKRFFVHDCGFKDAYYTHALCSACSGLIGAGLGTPADVVKARVMNQPVDSYGKGLFYKGSIDCFLKTVQNEGLFALYKGFLPCWIRMGPWSLTFWLTYEQLRGFCGTSAF